MSRLILPRRSFLAAPALILPYRRSMAQALPGPGPGTPAAPPAAQWTLVAASTVGVSLAGPAVTGSINSTGANLLVIMSSYYAGPGVTPSFVDSQNSNPSNTYTQPAGDYQAGGSNVLVSSNICVSPTHTGINHTFSATWSSGDVYAVVMGLAFKSATGTPFTDYDAGNGLTNWGGTSGTTVVQPSITPAHANDLMLAVLGDFNNFGATYSINSGFTLQGQQTPVTGQNMGFAGAWKLISGTPAVAPTWTLSQATTGVSTRMWAMGSV